MRPYIFCVLLSLSCLTSCSGPDSSSNSVNAPIFHELHRLSEDIYDGNGTWGEDTYGYQMALRDSYWRADVYGHISEDGPGENEVYAQRASEVYAYLKTVQSEGGNGVFGFPADINNPEFGSIVNDVITTCPECVVNGWVISLPGDLVTELYYDHGYALTALSKGYIRTSDESLLENITAAANWTLDKPLTANLNYLSALGKGLSYAYEATGNTDFLNRAVYLHETGILPNLSAEEGSAVDAHNQQLEYHGFIVSGLVALRRVLPEAHPAYDTISAYMDLAITHMRQRNMSEGGDFGVTWPGTNLLAWYEISKLRPLTPDEINARNRCVKLIQGYKEDILMESGFRFQKALYSNYFAGLVE